MCVIYLVRVTCFFLRLMKVQPHPQKILQSSHVTAEIWRSKTRKMTCFFWGGGGGQRGDINRNIPLFLHSSHILVYRCITRVLNTSPQTCNFIFISDILSQPLCCGIVCTCDKSFDFSGARAKFSIWATVKNGTLQPHSFLKTFVEEILVISTLSVLQELCVHH